MTAPPIAPPLRGPAAKPTGTTVPTQVQKGPSTTEVMSGTLSLWFTMSTGQTPEHFATGWWAKAKSISVDPAMTIFGPGGMLNKAADKAVDKLQGQPERDYVTQKEHADQLDAILQIAMTLFPGLKFRPGPGFRSALAVTPEGVAISVVASTNGATVTAVPAGASAAGASRLLANATLGGKKSPPATSDGPGTWEEDLAAGHNMNPEQHAYQEQITQRPASRTYHLNGTAFDGFEKGVKGGKDTLIEAKHLGDEGRFAKAYQIMRNDPLKLTDVHYLIDNAEAILQQARDQVRATRGMDVRIEWRVSGQRAEEALNLLFSRDKDLAGRINVKYVKFEAP
jgi:hypothetical protein